MKGTIFTVDNLYFVIAIAIFTLWLTIVTTKGGLTDNRYHVWWKKITKRGRIAISIGIFIAIILALQEVNNRNVSKNNSNAFNKEQSSRDSIITNGINSGVNKATENLFNNLSIAFKKQGLQYDMIKNQVSKLKDSIRITVINGEAPLIYLRNLKILDSSYFKKTYTVKYYIACANADSHNTDVLLDIFAISPRGNIFKIKENLSLVYKGQIVRKNEELSSSIVIPRDTSFYFMYAFRLKGHYYKHDDYRKKIKVDNFYLLRPRVKEDVFTIPLQMNENTLRSYLSKNSIN
ncbi:hypothetical protein ACHRV5_14805 [Flavobacterium sp. FlaQc-52]|jgi:hypothetical protein|uniref:hypothetical protein n=1 Tax=Flavobacterium sp. FlaQc-52 TaxID=3374185 RepID=UPI00375698BA